MQREKRLKYHLNKCNIGLWIAALCLILGLAGCTSAGSQETRQTVTGSAGSKSSDIEGVVTANDTVNGQLTLKDLGGSMETTISYDASAKMTDRYGQERDGSEIEIGEILQAKYDNASGRLLETGIPEDVWEYQEVDDYKVDSSEGSISFADRKYKYTDDTLVSAGGKTISLMEINPQDVLTVRGIGYNVYSVVRAKGHGYIRLANYKDFIGGMIEVGSDLILPVAKNMLLTVREGSYKVILCKDHSTAVKNVIVREGKEVTLDFSDYKPADRHIGIITFDIEPAGADLTINGTAVGYTKPIALAYGTYQIQVSMTGYTTYKGTLDVAESKGTTVKINLVEEKAEAAETTTSPSSSQKSNKKSSGSTQTKKMDSDHTITVSAPEGAEVYLDNVYKGIAPCSFTKIIGSQTISLRKDGYTPKSYSVDVLDDGEDVKLSFSDLKESSDATEETAAPATPAASP